MKKLIVASILSLFAVSSIAAGEVKKSCKDKVDAKGQVVKGKDGKPVQVCKEVKVHKKAEGNKVPDKKASEKKASNKKASDKKAPEKK